MKNRTFKVIVILVGLLFLNIEAAHAGLVQKFKLYIGHEFPGYQPVYIIASILSVSLLSYIILTPMPFKETGKLGGGYYPQQTFQNKRSRVKKISAILKEQNLAN